MATDDLSVLIPGETVQTSAGEILVKPFPWKSFKSVLQTISKYYKLITASDGAGEIVQALLGSEDSQVLEDVAYLVSLACGRPADFLDNLTWDEVGSLLLVVIGQNLDFFNRAGQRLAKISGGESRPADSAPVTPAAGEQPSPA